MRHLTQRLTIMLLIIVVIGVLGYLTREFASMQWLVENEFRMRAFVYEHAWYGWLLGFGIYTAFSLIPGTSGKSVVWGWLFGFWPAVVIVDMGLTVAAIISFLAARFLFADAVNTKFQWLVRRLDHSRVHQKAFYLLLLRLAHVPFTLVNYGAGATSVRLSTFSWTTALGILPGTMIFVFVGTRIPTLEAMSQKGVWQLLDPLLVGILAATCVFPLLVHWAMSRYQRFTSTRLALGLTEFEIRDWKQGK